MNNLFLELHQDLHQRDCKLMCLSICLFVSSMIYKIINLMCAPCFAFQNDEWEMMIEKYDNKVNNCSMLSC
jgi:hypothetical protein